MTVSMVDTRSIRNGSILPGEANSAAVAVLVTKNARRADRVRFEKVTEFVLVHRFRKVGHVEVGVALVGKRLELRVEGLLKDHVSGVPGHDAEHKLTLAKLTS